MAPKISLDAAARARFRRLWKSGTPVAEICRTFKLSHDTVNTIRTRLGLPSRACGRRLYKRRSEETDPTPEEIEAACAELRAQHLEKRLAESPARKYRDEAETHGRVYPCDVFNEYE